MQKVLIISRNDDHSTSEVIKWLIYYKKKFIRINENDSIKIIRLDSENFIFLFKGVVYDINEFSSIWYRRSDISFDINFSSKYLEEELKYLKKYIHYHFGKRKSLNNFLRSDISKLDLYEHEKILSIIKLPKFLVTQSKSELKKFIEIEAIIISKPIFIPFFFNNEKTYASYTSKIENSMIKKMSTTFVPTLFQKIVSKKYEIRSFYINEKFYSMVIFSQKNNQTKIDFRNYDDELPNRTSPFKLPDEIESELREYFKCFKLESASFDIILDKDNIYTLIDVNPIGQFGMVSEPCNYYLEKKIALFLAD
jgi:ATP-GRASP peptide maturase of grasp-with-spasm system